MTLYSDCGAVQQDLTLSLSPASHVLMCPNHPAAAPDFLFLPIPITTKQHYPIYVLFFLVEKRVLFLSLGNVEWKNEICLFRLIYGFINLNER